MRDDGSDNWVKGLLASIGAAVAVTVVAGAALGLGALGAANVLGLGGDSQPSGAPSLYLPPLSRTPSPERPAAQSDGSRSPSTGQPSSESSSDKPGPSTEKKHHKHKKHHARHRPVLSAHPQRVAPMGRIYLTGNYRGRDGTVLQVQQFMSGWSDFPVTVTVHDGSFSTYVQTGHTGQQRFRVVDSSAGRTSKPVSVTVG